MKLFRNPEINKAFIMCAVLGIIVSSIAFLWDDSFGYLMLSTCIIFLVIFYMVNFRRYKKISELAAGIDKILHGEEKVNLEQYAEGELAILHSEISKMTVRLREQQQKLIDDKAYLADSLADISHQIRTPLTSINLLVNFLAEPDISIDRRQKLSYELFDLLSRIDWLITALLKISKLDAGTVRFNKEQTSLENLIHKAVSPVLIPMELREQTLDIQTSGEFTGDISWTGEAITNIVKNCMEHTQAGGNINITGMENPLYSEIVITDNGSGILAEDLPHIFERFYKGTNSDKNSFGIGLHLARMIITAQNGTIKAENNKPNGAKFTIRFYKGTV